MISGKADKSLVIKLNSFILLGIIVEIVKQLFRRREV